MSKVSIKSPANIAFIKHWGFTNKLPASGSLSMNLSHCFTVATFEFLGEGETDDIKIITHSGHMISITDQSTHRDLRLYQYIQELKELVGKPNHGIKIISRNSFPSSAGIASSASGFSAIASGMLLAGERDDLFEDKQALANIILQGGSVSACRSVLDDFCMLTKNNTDISVTQFKNHSDLKLVDIIAIISDAKKEIGSASGQAKADTSAHQQERIQHANDSLETTKQAIKNNEFTTVSTIGSEQSKLLHRVMNTSVPPLHYIQPAAKTLVKNLTSQFSSECFVTFDAGTNPHIITTKKDVENIRYWLESQAEIQYLIVNNPCSGTHQIEEHLF